jgi:hypothetical protein
VLDLKPSREKIARAERKLATVRSMMTAFVGEEGVLVITRRVVENDRTHVIARVDRTPDPEIGFEIVEAVLQLRGALDKAMMAAAQANGGGLAGVGFPFGGLDDRGVPQPFPGNGFDKLKKKFTDAQWDCVLAQQPHPDGNRMFWAINDIANQDKHKLDLVKVRVSINAPRMEVSQGIFIVRDARPAIAFGGDPNYQPEDPERDTVLLSHAPGAPPNIDHDLQMAISFGTIKSIPGYPAARALEDQIALVKGFVDAFAAL